MTHGNDCRDAARGKIRGGEARARAAERGRRRFWKEGLTGGPRTSGVAGSEPQRACGCRVIVGQFKLTGQVRGEKERFFYFSKSNFQSTQKWKINPKNT
jgi:hypothetical protein